LYFFSVAYKHLNSTGEITLYLAQTGLPSYMSNMYVHVGIFERILFMHGYWKNYGHKTHAKYAFTRLLTNGCCGLEFFLHNDLKIILQIVHIKLWIGLYCEKKNVFQGNI